MVKGKSNESSRKLKQGYYASREKGENVLAFWKMASKAKPCFSFLLSVRFAFSSARCKKETEFLVLHMTNGAVFLHWKIIRAVARGVPIVSGQLIVSWIPQRTRPICLLRNNGCQNNKQNLSKARFISRLTENNFWKSRYYEKHDSRVS